MTNARRNRELLAKVPNVASKFADCAKTFKVETNQSGLARWSDAPPHSLAVCLDPVIGPLVAGVLEKNGAQYLDPVARRKWASRICDKIRKIIDSTLPSPCLPFLF